MWMLLLFEEKKACYALDILIGQDHKTLKETETNLVAQNVYRFSSQGKLSCRFSLFLFPENLCGGFLFVKIAEIAAQQCSWGV